ncbi:redoxin domain-containing protein [Haliangium sp.]|uniref:TlpA family protein disulfide reductase n=1 Tax=Haliangium sp. TaxID=2663208 RepID=UPI003D0FCB8D
MKNIAVIGAVCVVAAGLFFVLSNMVTGGRVEVGIPSASACAKAGSAECLPTLAYVDTDGREWSADELAGKVVMVNFWASWCGPCKTEIPALSATQTRYADRGFVILGVMMDAAEVSPEQLTSFAKSHDLHYPIVPVDNEIWTAFDGPDALPTTFIYDRAGKLRVHHRGPLSEADLEQALETLLAESAPQ